MNRNERKRSKEPQEHRLNEITRASIWLALAVAVFLCVVVMCLSLIRQSAETDQEVVLTTHIADIQYVAAENTEPSESVSGEDVSDALVSVNDSARLNYLIAAVNPETNQTDTVMILNLDKDNGSAALMSIPRDTYVYGQYDIAKIDRIYDENAERGAAALVEATSGMLGFELDGYIIFREDCAEEIFNLIDRVELNIPKKPDYHTLSTGDQVLDGQEAFELFCYRDDYNDVETDSCELQLMLMSKIMEAIVQDAENAQLYAELISHATETNLTAQTLNAWAQLLATFNFEDMERSVIPGEEIEVDDAYYYQVEIEDACQLLNDMFNPLDEELTEFEVLFRQKLSSEGIGVDSDFSTSKKTTATEESEEPTEEDTREELPDDSEESTEEPTQEEPTETPEPIEPNDPDGDE